MTLAMQITDAIYTPQPLSVFQGNPLIEALPPALSPREIQSRVDFLPLISDTDRAASTMMRLALIEDINYAYQTSPQLLRLYTDTYTTLLQSYRFRNPLASSTQAFLYSLSGPNRNVPVHNHTTASATLFIGPSGLGKSTTIANLQMLFPAVVKHTTYHKHELFMHQPIFLKVDCPSNGSKTELIQNIWRAMDQALMQTDYTQQYKTHHWEVCSLKDELRSAMLSHGVGMLIVDELQNLHPNHTSGNDKASLSFMEELFNSIGIPVLLVGTWETVKLLSDSMKTVRRTTGDTPMIERPYKRDSKYWTSLVDGLWSLQYCHQVTPLTDEFRDVIYHCTAGLPALLKRLVKAANKRAIISGHEKIDMDILESVYANDFLPLQRALDTLRSGNRSQFEDLVRPEVLLSRAFESHPADNPRG
jgi:energy-coupling factor transporter ATP-binding protein EcfA2